MIVTSLYLGSFYQWRDAAIPIDPGLTFILGTNGAGKSSILEAVVWTIWKRRIRGAGSKLVEPHVDLQLRDRGGALYRIRRIEGKGAALNFWTIPPGSDEWTSLDGQTATATQERIDAIFGGVETFLATRVFSGQRGVTFGGQTNGDRQGVLMDVIPALSGFERAGELSRARHAAARESFQLAVSNASRVQAVLSEIAGELELKRQALAQPGDAAALPKALERAEQLSRAHAELVERADKAQTLSGESEKELTSENAVLGGHQRGAVEAEKRLRALRELGAECPTCLQPVPPEHKERVEASLAEQVRAARAAYADCLAYVEQLRSEAADLSARARSLAQAARTAGAEAASAAPEVARLRAEEEARRRSEADLQRLEARLVELKTDLEAKQAVAAQAEQAVEMRQGVADVLGPKGARLLMMEGALGELTVLVNEFLRRIGSVVQAKFSPTKPTATGNSSAQVHVRVYVDGRQGEYGDLSGGERARLDVATLFALASLAGPGALFFDEVFDPLDDEGLEGVAALLGEMAVERQLWVISHNPRLTSIVPQCATLRVRRGPDGHSQIAA